MRVVVTGGTGFIGSAIVRALVPDHEVVALTRHPEAARLPGGARAARWEAMAGPPEARDLAGAGCVIHLAGEPIAAGRWSPERKRRILESREIGTQNLIRGLDAAGARGGVFACASAVGIYGDRGDEELDESSAPGEGFLADVCKSWEAAAGQVRSLGFRVINVRFGFVIGRGGGGLARMLGPFRLGAGGRLGSGRQWMSWIHLADAAGLVLHALGEPRIDGPLNATAPAPVTNADFTRALGKALRRPAVLPVPRLALGLAFGEMADVLLSSQRVTPRRALQTGYRFRHPDLGEALAEATSE
ncbi:MAG: TIGR01777 family protein [Deltaproteobacteria bacterium]|nr:TIGR01777 family protein [Deltaproteobacteria bacterium]